MSDVHRAGTTAKAEDYDAIIIGTGQAAPALANRLTAAGMRIAVVERKHVGGTCVNIGCTPTKAMHASAVVAHAVARAGDYGVRVDGGHKTDLARVNDRVSSIVTSNRAELERWLQDMPGCSLIRGHASFVSPNGIVVGEQALCADKIFINVGARALIPDIPGISSVDYLTNQDMVALRTLPRHLAILGGGYVGLEFAQMFARFGARVTMIERGTRLLSHEDEDVSEVVLRILEGEGIDVRRGTDLKSTHKQGEGICLDVRRDGRDEQIGVSHMLVASGRRPNTDGLGLEKAGVRRDEAGFIVVDDRLATNVPGIWALGDCNGRGAFTHTAYDDFQIVSQNLLDGADRTLRDRIPASALYIDPPLGRAGMTLKEAKASGRRIRIGMRWMSRVARAVEKGEERGFMRVVVDADTDQILGATVLGPGGDESIHEIIGLMAGQVTARQASQVMGIHPTVSELLPTILGELRDGTAGQVG